MSGGADQRVREHSGGFQIDVPDDARQQVIADAFDMNGQGHENLAPSTNSSCTTGVAGDGETAAPFSARSRPSPVMARSGDRLGERYRRVAPVAPRAFNLLAHLTDHMPTVRRRCPISTPPNWPTPHGERCEYNIMRRESQSDGGISTRLG